jgi:hypothetical protein
MIRDLQHPLVRDLAWALFSDSLVALDSGDTARPCGLELTARRQRWLTALDGDPVTLSQHVARVQPRRLGHYFETLWHFFLERDPDVELIAHNLPVREDGQTLGEFDCIYFCHQRQRFCHLELAVKYYLAWLSPAPGNPGTLWLGPDSDDRLDRKLARLLDHQSLLAETDAGRAALEKLGVTEPLREIALKGYLFHREPKDAIRDCPGEYWLRQEEFFRQRNYPSEFRFVLLPRLRWLARADRADDALLHEDLCALLQRREALSRRPNLVAALDGTGEEIERLFVVPAQWPELSAESQS